MIESYAVINSAGKVINIVQWDSASDWECPEGMRMVMSSASEYCVIGASYSEGEFFLPTEQEPAPDIFIFEAAQIKTKMLKECTMMIETLADASEMSMASEAEKASLIEWKKYRVLLNRTDITTAPSIIWPEKPVS